MGEIVRAPLWNSARLTMAFFAFFAFLLFYSLRVNTGFAIVCMVNHTAIRHHDTIKLNNSNSSNTIIKSQCGNNNGRVFTSGNLTRQVKRELDGELVWNKHTQGLVHGSLFWGYILTNMAGGILATKFGGKRVIGLSLLSASLLTILVPVVARHDAILFMALRFLTGMTGGFVSPAMQSLWSFWAPPLESSKLRSIGFAGAQLGKVLTYPVTALLCEYGFDGGWPTLFYLQGVVGVLWFISWYFMVFDTPGEHPRISQREKDYIETSLEGIMPKSIKTKDSTPWIPLLTSPRVWAIIVTHTCGNWGEYLFLTNIPTYLEEVLHFSVKQNGFLSSLPYICMWITISFTSWLADLIRQKGLLTTLQTRNIFSAVGFIFPAALLVGLSYVKCTEPITAVILLTLGVAFTGSQFGGGHYMSAGDIAPKYAGVIYGISNTFATIPGFLAPLTIGILTEDQTPESWRSVFFISAAIYVFGGLFFFIFASGDVQPWAASQIEIIIYSENPKYPDTDTNVNSKCDFDESKLSENQSDSLLDSSSHHSSSNDDSLIEVHDSINSGDVLVIGNEDLRKEPFLQRDDGSVEELDVSHV